MKRADAQPPVSVVTPVYNGERHLAECIESVLVQLYDAWEYVLVDNCCTDGSAGIMRRYAAEDSRIRIHRPPRHLPIMENWNYALRQVSAGSRYVKVVHADDWLFPECLSRMVAVAEDNPSVGIVGSYRIDDCRVNCDGLPFPSTVVPGRELCRATLREQLYVFGSPSTLLLRASAVREHEPFYNENNFHADTEACFKVLESSDFGYVHQVLTYTRRGAEAMTCFARRCNTFLPGSLYLLKTYGPRYLPREEYEARLEEKLCGYYRFLGKSLLEGKDRRFWDYHRKAFADMGCGLNTLRLAYYGGIELAGALLNPRKGVARLRARLGRRRDAAAPPAAARH